MKIEQYGYIVKNVGPGKNWQSFEAYPLKAGLPILQADNLSLHYTISLHGSPYITIKENNLSIHVITQFWRQEDPHPIANRFIAPFFIEKTKNYKAHNHTQFVFSILFNRVNQINPTYDKAWNHHPYRELQHYCQTHFGLLDLTARTEIEAGR